MIEDVDCLKVKIACKNASYNRVKSALYGSSRAKLPEWDDMFLTMHRLAENEIMMSSCNMMSISFSSKSYPDYENAIKRTDWIIY